jgi:hypothetical protein
MPALRPFGTHHNSNPKSGWAHLAPVDEAATEIYFDGKAYQLAICSELITGGDGDDTEFEVPPHPCGTPGKQIVKH